MLMPIDGTLRRNERYRGNRAGLKKTAPARERGRILPELRLGEICADRIKPRDLSGSERNQRLRAIILRSGGVGLSKALQLADTPYRGGQDLGLKSKNPLSAAMRRECGEKPNEPVRRNHENASFRSTRDGPPGKQ